MQDLNKPIANGGGHVGSMEISDTKRDHCFTDPDGAHDLVRRHDPLSG